MRLTTFPPSMRTILTLTFPLSLALASTPTHLPSPLREPHANHIFNAVNSAMRQWGSSLHHNGMSAFIAHIPANTQFYHGTGVQDRVNGTEWLAFEPEHALQFAHAGQRPGGGRGVKRGGGQIPLGGVMGEDGEGVRAGGGLLHAYRTVRDLRLLYVDGQSAAKSDLGTLDLQDVVLLHGLPLLQKEEGEEFEEMNDESDAPLQPPDRPSHHGGGVMYNEWQRATRFCEMAQNEWGGLIDGVLRMELGFEIILCDFERDLRVERITAARMWEKPTREDMIRERFNYYHAVSSRFDGIGGNRVVVEDAEFVSLFAIPGALTWMEDRGRSLPRAVNESRPVEEALRSITEMILKEDHGPPQTMQWQAATDLLVARYADRIRFMAEGPFTSLASFRAEVDAAMRPFVDYGQRNTSAEIARCAAYAMPSAVGESGLSARALADVANVICSSLVESAEQESLSDAVQVMVELKEWLGWSTWKRCADCTYDQVCFLPIWPWGGMEDMQHIRCRSDLGNLSSSYWVHFERPT